MATRREFLRRSAELVALAEAARAAPKIRISHFEINSVRVPFHERVREAWLRSWEHQKRDQVDYVHHFARLHTDEGLTGVGEAKSSRTQAEAKLKLMVGKSPWDYLLDDGIGGILIAVYDLLGKAV